MHPLSKIFCALFAAIILTACGAPPSKNDQGISVDPKFPALSEAQHQGTYPNLDNLRTVTPGMNKAQVIDLLGPPHFGEGLFGVREWNYAFNFRVGNAIEPRKCQFKVLFDKESVAQGLYWLPSNCDSVLRAPAIIAPATLASPPARPAPPAPFDLRLQANSMFKFASAQMSDIEGAGRRELDKLAESFVRLHRSSISFEIEVKGHADDIGSDVDNRALSLQRAETIKAYLVKAGVPASSIATKGFGEASPQVQCKATMKPAQRIDCLAPNRRVDVIVRTLSR
jgi:OOP family OmpA-OmpF porin